MENYTKVFTNANLGTGSAMFGGRTVSLHGLFKYSAVRWADNTVFFINIATVIGPTPPGTGVTKLATSQASS